MKLFIPGPVHVRPEILQAMAQPMIGHRSQDMTDLLGPVITKLKKLLYTDQEVFAVTSSATGCWEMAVRNLCRKRMLAATCGAFSERWADVARANGKDVDVLSVDWGQPNLPDRIDDALRRGEYDCFTIVHNETSTGLTNPLAEVAEVLQQYPDVLFMVDAVSSMAGLKIEFDRLGLDFCLASTQKAFALPPGLAIAAVSHKAMDRAAELDNRGYYFDLLSYKKYAERGQTISTPALPQIFALARQLDDIFAEGLEQRYARHREMAELVRAWACEHFDLFAAPEYASDTVTTVANTRDISVNDLNAKLRARHDCIISNGYGKLKDDTFRISHMGDLHPHDLKALLGWIDDILGL